MQLCSLPLFLHFWSMRHYGEWLLTAAIPAYFSLADAGLVAVASNKMTMLSARGQQREANEIFQTALALTLLVSAACFVATIALVWNLPLESLTSRDTKLTLSILSAVALLNVFTGLFDAVFRAAGFFASGVYAINLGRLVEWAGGMLALALAGSMVAVATGMLLARLAVTLSLVGYSTLRFQMFEWHVRGANLRELRAIMLPSLSFLAFPVGNLLSFQGMTVLVGSACGPVLLALFSSYRTVARLLVQLLATFSRSLWPELSRAFGTGDEVLLRRMYVSGTRFATAGSLGACVLLIVFGRSIIEHWTGGKIPYDQRLFGLSILVALLSCLWQVKLVLLQATNRHLHLAALYLIGSLLSLAAAAALLQPLGLAGALCALGAFELLMMAVSRNFVARLLRG
jgi:O-antigen/teichoic acid export membrane protein